MKKTVAATIAAIAMALPVAPALADDGGLHGVMMIPVRAVAFGVGAVVGTPIAVVRKVAENDKDMGGEACKSDNCALKGASMLVCLPLAVFKGGLEGCYWGVANSWSNSSEKPFSKDSFSLGDMDK